MQLSVRRVVVAAALTLTFLVTSAAAGTPTEATVATGKWGGANWRLKASASRDGSYCVAMTVSSREVARSCGTIRKQRISYMEGTDPKIPAFVVGPVISSARSVEVSFYDHSPIRVRTLVPPRSVDKGTRFFATVLPCPASPRRFVARNQFGIFVARLVVPRRLHPKPHC
jgi:hypothetical protein